MTTPDPLRVALEDCNSVLSRADCVLDLCLVKWEREEDKKAIEKLRADIVSTIKQAHAALAGEAGGDLEERVIDAVMSCYHGTEFPAGMTVVQAVRAVFTEQQPAPRPAERERGEK